MCRVVAYLGEPVPVDVLLYASDSSLVRQAYSPRMLHLLNLAGCGVATWSSSFVESGAPLVYRDATLPMYDRNLMSLARKLTGECVLAHVRGTDYMSRGAARVGRAQVHPFHYEGVDVVLAHNGTLARFDEMKFDLLDHIDPDIAGRIEGTTDSEWLYAVLLSQLDDPSRPRSARDLRRAVTGTLEIVRDVRRKRGIDVASAANLFVADGANLVVTRFVFDFGCYDGPIGPSDLFYQSLWYTAGRDYGLHDGEWRMAAGVERDAILVASEPLTEDSSTWVEVPEYTLLTAERTPTGVEIATRDLDV